MARKYLYENHLGGFYTSYEQLDYDLLYCETCGDCDILLGCFKTLKDLKALLKDYELEDDYIERIYYG